MHRLQKSLEEAQNKAANAEKELQASHDEIKKLSAEATKNLEAEKAKNTTLQSEIEKLKAALEDALRQHRSVCVCVCIDVAEWNRQV